MNSSKKIPAPAEMKLYRAYYADDPDGVGIYENKPNGNLFGDLPAGARPQNDPGTLNRRDGGDPFERAIYIIPPAAGQAPPTAGQALGRTIIIERQSSRLTPGSSNSG